MSGYPRENFGHILTGRQGEKKSCSDIPLFGLYAYRYASNESVSRVDKPPLPVGNTLRAQCHTKSVSASYIAIGTSVNTYNARTPR